MTMALRWEDRRAVVASGGQWWSMSTFGLAHAVTLRKIKKLFTMILVRCHFSTFLGLLQLSRKPRIGYDSRIAISSKYGKLSGGLGTVELIQNWVHLGTWNYLKLELLDSIVAVRDRSMWFTSSIQAGTIDRQWFCMDTPSKCPHFKAQRIFLEWDDPISMSYNFGGMCLSTTGRYHEVVGADWGWTRAACIILRSYVHIHKHGFLLYLLHKLTCGNHCLIKWVFRTPHDKVPEVLIEVQI